MLLISGARLVGQNQFRLLINPHLRSASVTRGYQAIRFFRRWCIPRFATSFDRVRRARFCARPATGRFDRSGGPLRRSSPSLSRSSSSSRHVGLITKFLGLIPARSTPGYAVACAAESLSFLKMFRASPHKSAMSLWPSIPGKYIQTPSCRDHTSPVVSSGLPHTASSGPGRAASCCTSVFSRPSCSADADCKSTKARSTRCRTDWRIASSPVVHTIVAQCSSCAARTHSCARRAEVDTTKHVCNAAGARHLAGARASGDTKIAGELNCKSLMKYGPSKLHFVPATARSRPPHPQTHSQR
jgi:hypothetical protein